MCSSPEKTFSPALSIPSLPVVLSVELRPHGLSSLHTGVSVAVVRVPLIHRLSVGV